MSQCPSHLQISEQFLWQPLVLGTSHTFSGLCCKSSNHSNPRARVCLDCSGHCGLTAVSKDLYVYLEYKDTFYLTHRFQIKRAAKVSLRGPMAYTDPYIFFPILFQVFFLLTTQGQSGDRQTTALFFPTYFKKKKNWFINQY